MRKYLFGIIVIVVIIWSCFIVWQFHQSETKNSLILANIEALAQTEVEGFDDCENACASNNNGKYCCTIKVFGIEFDLFSPYNNNDKQ